MSFLLLLLRRFGLLLPPTLTLRAGRATTQRLRAAMTTTNHLRAGRHTTLVVPSRRGTTRKVGASADNRRLYPARVRTTFRLYARDAMSVTSHLSFFRGEDITLDFQMIPPVDITGWTLSFKVADSLGGTVQFTKTPTIVDGPRGIFRVTIASADTSSITVGRWVWDCRRTDSGSKATLADGTLELRQEVTA